MFIDCEGEPVQELTAIEVRRSDFAIVDVFHAHANVPNRTDDLWSRKHVHGLDLDFLNDHGFPSENELCAAFHVWFSKRNSDTNFANNPGKEIKFLNIPIANVELPPWVERANCPAHRTALTFKKLQTPIGNAACFSNIHARYNLPRKYDNDDARWLAKKEWGYHCSLYDAYEAYLHFSHACVPSFL